MASCIWKKILAFPSQDLIMDDACGFNQFGLNPQQGLQKQQEQFMQLDQLQNFSLSLAAEIEKQRLEIDRVISLQNERLRLALQEQRKQQIALFLKKYESKILLLLKHKDEELAKAINKTKELEDFARKIEIENQTWHKIAKESETTILSLNSTIRQLKETAYLSTNEAEDAESCCDIWQDEENGEQGRRTAKMICRSCNVRNSCIIILPCRHLCSCKNCEVFLDYCPVCKTLKKACIEALI